MFKKNYRVMIVAENIARAMEVVSEVGIKDMAVRPSLIEDSNGVEHSVYVAEFKASEKKFEKFCSNLNCVVL